MAFPKVVNPDHLNDCHFFFNSSCRKGEDCEYRHCHRALMNEKVCSKWRQGQCTNENCQFRHCHVIVKRGAIKCHFEKTIEGCQKIHCPFQHEQPSEIRMEKLKRQPINKWIFPVAPVRSQGESSKAKEASKEQERRAKSLTRDLVQLSLSHAVAGSPISSSVPNPEPKYERKARKRNSVSENLKQSNNR